MRALGNVGSYQCLAVCSWRDLLAKQSFFLFSFLLLCTRDSQNAIDYVPDRMDAIERASGQDRDLRSTEQDVRAMSNIGKKQQFRVRRCCLGLLEGASLC